MSLLYSLVSLLFFYYNSPFVYHQQSRFAAPIWPYFSTVIDISGSFTCLLVICSSVTFPTVCGLFFISHDHWGVRSSFSSPSGSSITVHTIIFGVPHPACAASSAVSFFWIVCLLRHHLSCRRHFSTSYVRCCLFTSFPGICSKDVIWPCYLLWDRYYTARLTSRRRAWLAHYRELLVQIGRVSQTFTYAVVPGAAFIVPSLGQVDKLPAFPASCHRDGHSVVRNASSWPSVSRWDHTHSSCLCTPWYRSSLWM
ncbi:hypothetical protein EDB89DRAFT_1137441 [Lactarius sanguifluus]|nr:hypothetical protein EDB89DRAFT_1137441 [Lactarius sanguifluus]